MLLLLLFIVSLSSWPSIESSLFFFFVYDKKILKKLKGWSAASFLDLGLDGPTRI